MEVQKELSKLKGAKKDKAAGFSTSGSASGSGSAGSASGGGSGSGGSGRIISPEDADMLDMTLGMLRCSVCKDRFKNCAITRCVLLLTNLRSDNFLVWLYGCIRSINSSCIKKSKAATFSSHLFL